MIFSYPFAFDAPFRGSRRNIAISFGMDKLEWCGYPIVKKRDDMFSRFDSIRYRRVTDEQKGEQIFCDRIVHDMHSIAR